MSSDAPFPRHFPTLFGGTPKPTFSRTLLPKPSKPLSLNDLTPIFQDEIANFTTLFICEKRVLPKRPCKALAFKLLVCPLSERTPKPKGDCDLRPLLGLLGLLGLGSERTPKPKGDCDYRTSCRQRFQRLCPKGRQSRKAIVTFWLDMRMPTA